MKYILALDQGTTSSRAIVFDRAGRVKAVAQKEFPQIFPKPGWVEHDAEAIWKTQLATAKAAMKKARLTAAHIAAIGITNQRETTVLWDRATGEPIRRYEHEKPGDLIHVDVKKLGRIPDGGGHRVMSRQRGQSNHPQSACFHTPG